MQTKPFKSNRLKAILAINIYAIITVAFVYSNKVAINEMKTSMYDFLFILHLVDGLLACAVVCCSKQRSFKIAKKDHRILFLRSIEAWLLVVALVIGNTLLPITV